MLGRAFFSGLPTTAESFSKLLPNSDAPDKGGTDPAPLSGGVASPVNGPALGDFLELALALSGSAECALLSCSKNSVSLVGTRKNKKRES